MRDVDQTKGNDIMTLRNMMRELEPEKQKIFLAAIGPEARKLFETSMAIQWIALDLEREILAAAAAVLYPKDPRGVRRLAKQIANRSFGTIYKIFLRLPSIAFLVKRSSSIWKLFYRQGQATVEDFSGNRGTLVVRAFPGLSAVHRQYLCGFFEAILETNGAKHVHVELDESDPDAWR